MAARRRKIRLAALGMQCWNIRPAKLVEGLSSAGMTRTTCKATAPHRPPWDQLRHRRCCSRCIYLVVLIQTSLRGVLNLRPNLLARAKGMAVRRPQEGNGPSAVPRGDE